MEIRLELEPYLEELVREIAWKIPRALVYWCVIRAAAHAATGKYGTQVMSELTIMEALKRWEASNRSTSLFALSRSIMADGLKAPTLREVYRSNVAMLLHKYGITDFKARNEMAEAILSLLFS